MDIKHPYTFEVSGSELPESIAARLPQKPAADARLTITVAAAETDEEKFWALKEAIDAGIADIEAGRTYDGDQVLAELEKKFPPV